jgi:hypothetical protein
LKVTKIKSIPACTRIYCRAVRKLSKLWLGKLQNPGA